MGTPETTTTRENLQDVVLAEVKVKTKKGFRTKKLFVVMAPTSTQNFYFVIGGPTSLGRVNQRCRESRVSGGPTGSGSPGVRVPPPPEGVGLQGRGPYPCRSQCHWSTSLFTLSRGRDTGMSVHRSSLHLLFRCRPPVKVPDISLSVGAVSLQLIHNLLPESTCPSERVS